jgi:hypothetical protein
MSELLFDINKTFPIIHYSQLQPILYHFVVSK